MDECDDYKFYLEWVLIVITIIEQALSYTPEHYPKSILQGIIFIVYKTVMLFNMKKRRREERRSGAKRSSNYLILSNNYYVELLTLKHHSPSN